MRKKCMKDVQTNMRTFNARNPETLSYLLVLIQEKITTTKLHK